MDQDLFIDYATVCQQIKELEAKKDELNPRLLAYLGSIGDNTLQTGVGTFTVGSRKTYEYSAAIKERELTLKEAKKVEVEAGVAKSTETQFVRYQAAGARV